MNGDLLSNVGRVADNRMYPIVWVVVRGENKDTWGWFIKRLKVDLGSEIGDNYTINSDNKNGLYLQSEQNYLMQNIKCVQITYMEIGKIIL